VIHADETPVQMLAPARRKPTGLTSGPTAPRRSALKAVVYDFSPAVPANMRATSWALERQAGLRRLRWLQGQLRARHHRNRLHGPRPPQVLRSAANKSQLAEQALHSIGGLYEVERQARDMSDEDRWRIRQEKAVTDPRNTA
jgi:hypothetical protein